MDFLSDNIESFNKAVSTASEKFAQSPQAFSEGIYSMVVNVNEALVPLAMALLVTYFIFSFYENAVTFKMNDYKVYISIVANLALGLVILYNNLDILQVFYILSNTVLDKVGVVGASGDIVDSEVIASMFENISIWSDPLGFFDMIFSQVILIIVFWVANFVITFAILSRMFEIYLYMAFSPIAMCSFVSDTTRGIGKNYMTNFCAVVLKSSVIVLVLKMYYTYLLDTGIGLADGTGSSYIISSAISGILIITLILGAEKLTKTIVGSLK